MKKFVTFELEENIYQLRFGVNELCDIESLLDRPVSELSQRAGMTELRVMFYCGLRGSQHSLTLEKAGQIMSEVITEKGIDFLQDIISQAMELALGKSTPSKGTNSKKK